MATKLKCAEAKILVELGVLKSGDIRKLVMHGVVSSDCGVEVIRQIRSKVQMNGRRRK